VADRLEFIKGVAGQRLYFDAPEGRPTATPTVIVKDQGGATLAAEADTNVTQNSVATTLSASASKEDGTVTLAAVTGLELGKRYRLVNGENQVDWVTVRGWNATSKVVELASPLAFDFDVDRDAPNGDYGAFESTEWYYTLQEGDGEELGQLREQCVAIAKYAVGGLTYWLRQPFDSVFVPLANFVTVQLIYDRWPDIARVEPKEQFGSDYLAQRVAAWQILKRRILQHSVANDQWRPAMIVDVSDLNEWALAVFAQLCLELGVKAKRDTSAEQHRQDVLAEQKMALDSISWLDTDEDESKKTAGEGTPIEPALTR
jgi:hypothetical protein